MKLFAIAFVTLTVLISHIWAAPSVQDNRVVESDSTFARTARYWGACFDNDDVATCLTVKGITALNRAARSNDIELSNGFSFKRDPSSSAQRSGKALSENDIYADLPAAAEERSGRLVDMAIASVTDFLNTHNLQFKLPADTTQEVARALEEGRGKMKKLIGPMALAIGAKLFAIVPIVLGGLALLTAKAVVVAKIALVLAIIVGGSRLFGGFGNKLGGSLGGGYNANGWSSGATAGWSSPAASAYPYARSMNNIDAQELAYAGQKAQQ